MAGAPARCLIFTVYQLNGIKQEENTAGGNDQFICFIK